MDDRGEGWCADWPLLFLGECKRCGLGCGPRQCLLFYNRPQPFSSLFHLYLQSCVSSVKVFGGQSPAGVYVENHCGNGGTVRLGHLLWGQSEGLRTCAVSATGSHLWHEHWSHPDNARRGGSYSQTLLETEEPRRSHIRAGRLQRNGASAQCVSAARASPGCRDAVTLSATSGILGLAGRAQRVAKG